MTKLLSVDEVAGQTGLGRSTLYRVVSRHEIEVVRLGGRVLISQEALDAWVARRTFRAVPRRGRAVG